MLDRCRATETCPKIFETMTSAEFWDLRMSPGLVGTSAHADIPLPRNVRRYYYPSTTHGGGAGGFSTATSPAVSVAGPCILPINPNPTREQQRALLVALRDWVVNDIEPPPSRYPLLRDGTLVAPTKTALGFPTIPGAPSPDGLVNTVLDYDFGFRMDYNDLSGVITQQPPIIKQKIPTLVPKVDADGNEVAGAKSALAQAPLGTYLGWNVVSAGVYSKQICSFTGGLIPFSKTAAERLAAGDPRPSLEERYGNHAGYVQAVAKAADRLVKERFLLPEDAARLVAQAEAGDVLR